MICTLFFVTSVLFLNLTSARFTEDFATFLESNYGEKFTNILQRSDLGDKGSFGGRSHPDEEIIRDPVIFIHGVSDMAGERMKTLADKFRKSGYKSSELYATTYADGSHGSPLQFTFYSMRCEYVKQIRALILAVRYYTRRDVDIVAYSLGVTIARKAIMGGFCVDTDDDLGGPLTKYIDTFVGIAGPNHGITYKFIGIPLPGCVLGTPPICDRIIGLYSGICPLQSLFLNDINSREHYEGQHVFSIFSQNDQMIGYRVCDKITSSIPGEDGHKSYMHVSHGDLIMECADVAVKFISNHTADSYSLLALQRAAPILKTEESLKELDADLIIPESPKTANGQPALNTEAIFSETDQTSMNSIRQYFREQREERGKKANNREITTNTHKEIENDVEVRIEDVTTTAKTTTEPITTHSTTKTTRQSTFSKATTRSLQTTTRPITVFSTTTSTTVPPTTAAPKPTYRTTHESIAVFPPSVTKFEPKTNELGASEDGYYHTRIRIKIGPDAEQ